MKIYLVMQHHIMTNQNRVAAIFTKLEDAEEFKNWYSEDDNQRIFYIMEKKLYDKFDKYSVINEYSGREIY